MNKTKFLLIAEIITVSIFIVAIFTGNSFFISASFAATICFLGLLLGQRVKSKQQIIISTKKGIVISITCVLTIVIDMIILLFTKEYMTAIICISLITSIHVLLAVIVFLVFCVKKNRLSLSSLVLKLSEKRTKNTDSDLVVIGEYYRSAEADIVKGLLNDNDIAAICVGEEHSRPYLNGVYPIKVLINKADYDKANMILRNL